MNFSKQEYKARLNKVQSTMKKKGLEILISHDTANMNYLTGYDAWSFYYAQAIIIHVDGRRTSLLGKKTRFRWGVHKNLFKK